MHASEGMSKVAQSSDASPVFGPDRVSNVLKWILLAVAIGGAPSRHNLVVDRKLAL